MRGGEEKESAGLCQEREGKYLGKTVQVVPHITGEMISWIDSHTVAWGFGV